MTNKAGRTLLALAVLSFGAAGSRAETWPPPFPRKAAQKLFENNRVAVWDVTWPKGRPTAMHVHPVDQLSVTLVSGMVRVTGLGLAPVINESAPGIVVFTPQRTVHKEEGLSDVPQRKIMLQLKSLAGGSVPESAPETSSREGAIRTFENARVIVWDFTWKPGQKTLRPADPLDSVIVFIDGGTIRSIPDRGGSKNTTRSTGEVVYSPHSAHTQTEEAVRGSPRAIIVELK